MSKRGISFIVGGAVLLGVLAFGAFTAVRLLANDGANEQAGGNNVIESVMIGNDGVPISVRTTLLPAGELPAEQPATGGVLVRRQDNVLTVGTGNIDLSVNIEVDPSTGQETISMVPRTDGPELEIVVGVDTLIYEDVTNLNAEQPAESGEQTVKQKVRLVDSLEMLPEQAELQVWGVRNGDRVTAEVLVYGPLGGGAFE